MGTKCKIPIRRRETKEQIAVAFSKRRAGLYSKAADLCVLGGAKIAVLTTSPRSEETFYSFGNPSADEVVDAFLENRVPNEIKEEMKPSDLSCYETDKETKGKRQRKYENNIESKKRKTELGFWCEKEDTNRYQTVEELESEIERLQKFRNELSIVVKKQNQGRELIDLTGNDEEDFLPNGSSSTAITTDTSIPSSKPSRSVFSDAAITSNQEDDFAVADLGISIDSFGCGIKNNDEYNLWDRIEAETLSTDDIYPTVLDDWNRN